MRRFELHRFQDATGISGTGVVAQGVQFDDGTCAMRWLSTHRSTALYETARDVQLIHGHGGLTRLVWVDPPVAIHAWFQAGTDEESARALGRREEVIRRLGAAR